MILIMTWKTDTNCAFSEVERIRRYRALFATDRVVHTSDVHSYLMVGVRLGHKFVITSSDRVAQRESVPLIF